MPLDVVLLATTVVSSFLVPLLTKGAEGFGTKAGEAGASGAASLARTLWDRVRGAVGTSDDGDGALKQFEQRPAAAAPLLQAVLADELRRDGALADELLALVRSPAAAAAGVQVMGGVGKLGIFDARGAHFSGSGGTYGGYVETVAPPRDERAASGDSSDR